MKQRESKKRKKKQWKRLLDKKWALAIKLRAQGRCEWCKKTAVLNAHHIFSRRNTAVRWNLDNGIALDIACHFKSHQNPIEFVEFVKERLGVERYESLRRQAKEVVNLSDEDYERINEDLSRVISKG